MVYKCSLTFKGKKGVDEAPIGARRLKWAKVKRRSCSDLKKKGYSIGSKKLCVGNEDQSNKDTCQGDSGGPLACLSNGAIELVGIVSIGLGCGDERDYPGLYTMVIKYLNWIKKYMS